jgi:hypothetical protein
VWRTGQQHKSKRQGNGNDFRCIIHNAAPNRACDTEPKRRSGPPRYSGMTIVGRVVPVRHSSKSRFVAIVIRVSNQMPPTCGPAAKTTTKTGMFHHGYWSKRSASRHIAPSRTLLSTVLLGGRSWLYLVDRERKEKHSTFFHSSAHNSIWTEKKHLPSKYPSLARC